MAAGDGNGIAGAEDARPDGLALLDRLIEGNRCGARVTGASYGGDAGQKRLPSIVGHSEGELGVLFIGQFRPHLPGQLQAEVDVHVHEAGNEPHAVGGE